MRVHRRIGSLCEKKRKYLREFVVLVPLLIAVRDSAAAGVRVARSLTASGARVTAAAVVARTASGERIAAVPCGFAVVVARGIAAGAAPVAVTAQMVTTRVGAASTHRAKIAIAAAAAAASGAR